MKLLAGIFLIYSIVKVFDYLTVRGKMWYSFATASMFLWMMASDGSYLNLTGVAMLLMLYFALSYYLQSEGEKNAKR